MISYRVARKDEVELAPGRALVETFDAAKIVAEHFAIRGKFIGHPGGVEDLFILVFELDHMPTGRRCWAGAPGRYASEPECEALAMSLACLGDWSTEDVPSVDMAWLEVATTAAVALKYVDAGGEVVGEITDDEPADA